MAFDQIKYINEYKKKHKKQFKVELDIPEMEELEKMLQENGLTKTQFLKNAIEDLRKKTQKNKDKTK